MPRRDGGASHGAHASRSISTERHGGRFRAAAVVEAGLVPGVVLDRHRARVLARARATRARAEDIALRALARRDHSRVSLDTRLERAGVSGRERRQVVERAEQVRTGRRRAIRGDARGAARGAWQGRRLDRRRPRAERDRRRARSLRRSPRSSPSAREPSGSSAARGTGAQTARWLAARGFSEETVEAFVADLDG